MSERILPAPDVYAMCPMNGAILPFYNGVYEAAYILLHPFMRPKSSIELAKGMLENVSAAEVCKTWEAVGWSEVLNLSGLPSLGYLDVALRTSIGGLNAKYSNKELANKLSDSLEQHRLIAPCEGVFSELLLEPVLAFMQSLGQQWVWVGDEFCTERKLCWIDDMKPAVATCDLYTGSLFTPDKSSLWTVHWDSHFSLFCSSRDNVERMAQHSGIEGFSCGPTTEIYWSLHDIHAR